MICLANDIFNIICLKKSLFMRNFHLNYFSNFFIDFFIGEMYKEIVF